MQKPNQKVNHSESIKIVSAKLPPKSAFSVDSTDEWIGRDGSLRDPTSASSANKPVSDTFSLFAQNEIEKNIKMYNGLFIIIIFLFLGIKNKPEFWLI